MFTWTYWLKDSGWKLVTVSYNMSTFYIHYLLIWTSNKFWKALSFYWHAEFFIFSENKYNRGEVYDTPAISNMLLIMCYYSGRSSKHRWVPVGFLSLFKTSHLVPLLYRKTLGWEFQVAVGFPLSCTTE